MCTILAGMLLMVIAEAFIPYGSLPLPGVWGRGLRGRLARTRRSGQIVGILFRHGLWPYAAGRRRRALETATGRTELGRRLTAALNEAGVTFIKMGQILATRRDLLPAEVVDELRRLQDDADPVPWPQLQPFWSPRSPGRSKRSSPRWIADPWPPLRWGRCTPPGWPRANRW